MEPVRERKYPRIQVNLPVQVSGGTGDDHGHALMLGGGGMFIGTSHSFAPGSPLTIKFRPARHLHDQPIDVELAQIRSRTREFFERLFS